MTFSHKRGSRAPSSSPPQGSQASAESPDHPPPSYDSVMQEAIEQSRFNPSSIAPESESANQNPREKDDSSESDPSPISASEPPPSYIAGFMIGRELLTNMGLSSMVYIDRTFRRNYISDTNIITNAGTEFLCEMKAKTRLEWREDIQNWLSRADLTNYSPDPEATKVSKLEYELGLIHNLLTDYQVSRKPKTFETYKEYLDSNRYKIDSEREEVGAAWNHFKLSIERATGNGSRALSANTDVWEESKDKLAGRLHKHLNEVPICCESMAE